MATTAAFCVGGGMALSMFVTSPQPTSYLIRPFSAVALVAVVVGVAASLFGQTSALVAAAAMAWLVQPASTFAVIALVLVGAVIVWRLWKKKAPDIQVPVTVAAAVFLLAGLVPVVPLVSWSEPAHANEPGEPVYLILLDGYPRADTLASIDIDIQPFLDELDARGFDHYPAARSQHSKTFRSLTAFLTDHVGRDLPSSDAAKRSHRAMWQLPPGFLTVEPPVGHVTIPGSRNIGPAGFNSFDSLLVGQSAFGPWSGGWVMAAVRAHLDASLDVLADAEHPRVFAHLLSPHAPYLYDTTGDVLPAPDCWPECNIFQRTELSPDGLEGTLAYLNRRLIDSIDGILDQWPNATIVLFSDHGGKFLNDDPDEAYRVFLAARTPEQRMLGHAPVIGAIVTRLDL